jgi:ABC-type uncharacterized transport system permease subunit
MALVAHPLLASVSLATTALAVRTQVRHPKVTLVDLASKEAGVPLEAAQRKHAFLALIITFLGPRGQLIVWLVTLAAIAQALHNLKSQEPVKLVIIAPRDLMLHLIATVGLK